MQRRANSIFNPKETIALLKEGQISDRPLTESERRDLVDRYLIVSFFCCCQKGVLLMFIFFVRSFQFKQLMLKLDPDDPDLEDEDDKALKAAAALKAAHVGDGDKTTDSNHVNNINNSTTNNSNLPNVSKHYFFTHKITF
jgi:hypothetical protein